MEKIMSSSKIVLVTTIISCLLIVAVPVFYKAVANNHEKLYTVTNKLITEAAENCYYDKKCTSTTVTLKELYENNYLKEEVIDPVSKEIYSEDSYVEVNKEGSTFNKK